jgi:hypothetical protein
MGDVTLFGLFGPARMVVSGIADRFVLPISSVVEGASKLVK